jgi:hypothetical protein
MGNGGMNVGVRVRRRGFISAYVELQRRRHLDKLGVALVSRIVREQLKDFPGLRERDPEDVVHDFFVARITALTAMLLAQATNDDSYAKLTRRTAKNWIIDQARATGTGPLRRSIEKVLNQAPEFEQVPAGLEGAGRWRIGNNVGPPWAGDPDELLAVAWAVPNVRVPRWTKGTRRPPVADRSAMVAILYAVLQQAGGSVEIAQLVHVFARRFAAALDPKEVSLPDHENEEDADDDGTVGTEVASEEPDPGELVIAEFVAADVRAAAAEIVGRLSDQERGIVRILDDNAAVMQHLNRGRSQSALFVQQLKSKIRELAGTGDDRTDIVAAVIAQCADPADGQITR